MSRRQRRISSTGIYHIMMRGNEKRDIFLDDQDRNKFKKVLREKVELTNTKIYSYCLMDNHVHIVLKESINGVSDFLKRIAVTYVAYFNKKYDRVGHLFCDRFRSEVIEEEKYLLTVLRYVHNNPVRAGIVGRANEYKWSSFRSYIDENDFIEVDEILKIVNNDISRARMEFIIFSKDVNDDYIMDYDEHPAEVLDKVEYEDKKKRNIQIVKLYEKNRMKVIDIAKLFGLSDKSVYRILNEKRGRLFFEQNEKKEPSPMRKNKRGKLV